MFLKETFQGYHPEHPFTKIQECFDSLYHCMECIVKVVCLMLHTLVHYQGIQAKQVWSQTYPGSEASTENKEDEIDLHCQEFFDTCENAISY
jgi:hypothetical protein